MEIIEIPTSDIKNIDVVDAENLSTPNNSKKSCSSCKKALPPTHWSLIILSSYILFATIYGSIKLFKDIIALF